MMLQKQVQAAIEQKERFGLLFLDCDNFKEVNDQFGHDIGDAFLIQYAHRLTSCIRICDEAYRLGGDEFVILLRHIERREEIQQIMERIHRELQKNGVLNPAFLQLHRPLEPLIIQKTESRFKNC